VEAEWNKLFDGYRAQYPELAAEFERRMKGELPGKFERGPGRRRRRDRGEEGNHRHPQGQPERDPGAGAKLPEFLGGSADLTGSNLTNWKESSHCARAPRATTSTTACANSAWPP
jgi:transketolase